MLSKEPEKITWINYGIDSVGGGTIGSNMQRGLRSITSDCYLNYKIEEGLLDNVTNYP